MIFKLNIDKSCREEVIANVHERTPLIDEIERLVLQDSITDQIPGYMDDEITMLTVSEIECFVVEDERTYAVCRNRTRYLVKSRLYELEERLPGDFIRISKSAIANWKKISKDLYVGDVRPNERSFKRNSQYAEALDELVKVGDELTATLNEKEKELFESFMDAQREVTVLTDCETFCFAFKVGAKIMLDVLTDAPMKEI